MIRHRIEFDCLEDVLTHAQSKGGWIAKPEGRAYRWYSHSYTTTDIFEDSLGLKNIEVGVVGYWTSKNKMEVTA